MSQLFHYWTVDLVSFCLLASFGIVYGYIAGWQLRPGAGLYFSGLLLCLLVQTSPLHFLGAHYLMSAHMAGHILLLLVCAPLLVLGLPQDADQKAVKLFSAISIAFQQRPWLSWLIGLSVMWFWHVPGVYSATLAQHEDAAGIPLCTLAGSSTNWLINLLHILHPFSLLLAGICFSWPLVGPLPSHRIHPLAGVLYLFTACVGCSLLGLLITFAPAGLYTYYKGADTGGFNALVRIHWGFDQATDQQVAGLLMWVPCCFIYLTGALYLLRTWLLGKDEPIRVPTAGLLLEQDNV